MLEIPKRYKADQVERVKQLRTDIFTIKMPIDEIIKKYAKIITKMDDIPTGAGFVTYLQETRRYVNEWEHKRLGLAPMFVGMVLRANCHMGKKGSKATRITKHSEYKVISFTDNHTPGYTDNLFTLVDESNDDDIAFLMSMKDLKNFSHPYANTGHSLQGATIDKPIVIFDSRFQHVDRKWLYVALTRSSDMDTVYVFDGKMEKKPQLNIRAIDDKINGYIRQDIGGGRGYDEKNYVDVPWVLKQSKKQFHKCSCCSEVMNFENNGSDLDWTIDRANNDLGHTKNNCSLMCHHCNITKK